MTPEVLELLSEILRGSPSLPGALCRDWPTVFDSTDSARDPETRDYATATAIRLCKACPALEACQAWLANLPPAQRPPGVLAGQIQTPTHREEFTMTAPTNDKRRAAELLLACLDDSPEKANAILDEAHRDDGRLPGLIAALASGFIELLVGTLGEDGARRNLSLVLLDVQAGGDDA
jgi:hypothetical protein